MRDEILVCGIELYYLSELLRADVLRIPFGPPFGLKGRSNADSCGMVTFSLNSQAFSKVINTPQIALMQGTSAIVQGVQAFFIGDFSDLATKAFKSCIVSIFDIRVVLHGSLIASFYLLQPTSGLAGR